VSVLTVTTSAAAVDATVVDVLGDRYLSVAVVEDAYVSGNVSVFIMTESVVVVEGMVVIAVLGDITLFMLVVGGF